MSDDETSTVDSQGLAEKVASLTQLVTQQQKSLSIIMGDHSGSANDNVNDGNAAISTADSNDDLDKMMMDVNDDNEKCEFVKQDSYSLANRVASKF